MLNINTEDIAYYHVVSNFVSFFNKQAYNLLSEYIIYVLSSSLLPMYLVWK